MKGRPRTPVLMLKSQKMRPCTVVGIEHNERGAKDMCEIFPTRAERSADRICGSLAVIATSYPD